MTSTILATPERLRAYRQSLPRGQAVALVPTMGALHAGHLSLVKQAQQIAGVEVLVSIFVNPTQFGANEDLSRYPQTIAADCKLLEETGVRAVFCPSAADLYPPGFQSYVSNEGLALGLCGAARPGHFRGVCTVVLKLVNLVCPDYVFFGKKDYQQWKVIERMALDLNLSCKVVGCELVRDPDGLALSSRNVFLSASEREDALALPRSLYLARQAYLAGENDPEKLCALVRAELGRCPRLRIDYVAIRQQEDLQQAQTLLASPSVILAAIHIGTTRLLDNVELPLRETRP